MRREFDRFGRIGLDDLARCEDSECPSAQKCMRHVSHGQIQTLTIDFKREPDSQRCVTGWWPFDEEGQRKQMAAQRARRDRFQD